jgi:prophage regulatory protein
VSEENASTREYLSSAELEAMTGTPASTWRWWAHTGQGPASFKLGRRRVWKRALVEEWIDAQAHNQP